MGSWTKQNSGTFHSIEKALGLEVNSKQLPFTTNGSYNTNLLLVLLVYFHLLSHNCIC